MKSFILFLAALVLPVIASQKSDYLYYSEDFNDWDSLTDISTIEHEEKNQITAQDSLQYQYRGQLNEWELVTERNRRREPWQTFDAWYDFPADSQFEEWDSVSLFSNEYQVHAYTHFKRYSKSGEKFDTAQINPWYPDLALSYIPFGDDVTASAAHNPKYRTRIEIPLNIQAAYWSDRLALTPYREMTDLGDHGVLADYMTAVLKNSFNISDNDTPDETSEKMKRHLAHDVDIYSQISYRPLRISADKFNMEIRVYSDMSLKIPGDLFGILFSSQLSAGGTVDVSSLQSQAITALAVSGGGKSVRPVPSQLQRFLTGRGGTFKKVLSVDLITGIAFAEVQATSGELRVDDNGSAFSFHGEADILAAGTGIHGEFEFSNPFASGYTPAGYGASVDVGVEIADDKRAIAVYCNNLGAMRWSNVMRSTAQIHVDSTDVESTVSNGSESALLSSPTTSSFENIGSIWRPVATNFSIGMVQVLHTSSRNNLQSLYSRQLRVYGEYQQAVTKYPGTSFIPRIKMGIENDFLMGGLGTGYYMVLGGSEHVASGLNLRLFSGTWFTLDMEYTAYGSPVLYPKRGFGVSAVTQFFHKKDKWLR